MSENTGQPVSVAAFLGTFGAGLTTIASVISDVLTPLAPVSLYLGLLALVAFGTSYRSCALGLSLQNNDYDLTWPAPFCSPCLIDRIIGVRAQLILILGIIVLRPQFILLG